MTPKPTLAPYVDTSDPDRHEFRQMRREIHDAVMQTLPADLQEDMKRRMPHTFSLVALPDLEPVFDRVNSTLSDYERGEEPIPKPIMHLMRILHQRVIQNPRPAAKAVAAWWREEYHDPDRALTE